MADKRKNDTEVKTRFRTDRFMEHDGQWYFTTREGTTEGPFDSRWDAAHMLEQYLNIESIGLHEVDWEIVPKEADIPA